MTVLQHNFQTKAHSLMGLFYKVNKMSALMRNIETEALKDPIRYEANLYAGDAFEFFVELFLQLHPCDNRVGVYEYVPVQEFDNGVDGIGVNIQKQKCVVQIKFRTNVLSQLTATQDHLANMFSDGMLAHNVISDNKNAHIYRHFVFTTADGLHFYTDQEMFKNKVRCFGFQDFRNLLDNNTIFWDKCREIAREIDALHKRHAF
ncbi:MAG: hypothetical protein ACOC22_01490 [bacterium]